MERSVLDGGSLFLLFFLLFVIRSLGSAMTYPKWSARKRWRRRAVRRTRRTKERESWRELTRPHTAAKLQCGRPGEELHGLTRERDRAMQWRGKREGEVRGTEFILCVARMATRFFFYRSLTPLRSAVAFTTSLATIRLHSQGRSCAIFVRFERIAAFLRRFFVRRKSVLSEILAPKPASNHGAPGRYFLALVRQPLPPRKYLIP